MNSDRAQPLKLAALIGGGGRTLLNIADHIDRGDLNAEVVCVIASKRSIAGTSRAEARGFTVHALDDFPDDSARQQQDRIDSWLEEAGTELVCLCGWLQWFRVSPNWDGRVLNIHPALLPEFGGVGMYGMNVHRAVLAAGRAESGCTVHFVDDQYDHGPVVVLRRCPVKPDDTPESLAARVYAEECRAYPQAIAECADGVVRYVDGKVVRELRSR